MPAFRADRLATLYLFHPLRRLRPQGTRIPILMYHSISDVDQPSRHPYYRTSTTVQIFEQQVRFLHQNRYRTVSVREAFRRVQTPASIEKVVAITFDDGYRDFYTNAFPILTRYGYSATVFLPTAYIDACSRRFNDLDCLTWGEVRELRKAGVAFGSHTVTHPQLHDVSPAQLREEIAVSKQQIEQNLGEPAETFSYPYAFPEADRGFVRGLQEVLEESGYGEGVSTIVGRVSKSDNRFSMKRLPVNTHDDLRFFRAKLEGSYDWLHAIQYAAKLQAASSNLRTRLAFPPE